MRSISFLSSCITLPVTIGLLSSVFSAIYVALLIMEFFSIANLNFNYMPTRTLTGLERRMILPPPTPSLSILVAIPSLGVPRSNLQLRSPLLKPNTDFLLQQLLSFVGYLISSGSSVSPLLKHQLATTTMSVQPTSTRTWCSTHVSNMLHFSTTLLANNFKLVTFVLPMLLLRINLQMLSPNLNPAPIFISYYSRLVSPLGVPTCEGIVENQI